MKGVLGLVVNPVVGIAAAIWFVLYAIFFLIVTLLKSLIFAKALECKRCNDIGCPHCVPAIIIGAVGCLVSTIVIFVSLVDAKYTSWWVMVSYGFLGTNVLCALHELGAWVLEEKKVAPAAAVKPTEPPVAEKPAEDPKKDQPPTAQGIEQKNPASTQNFRELLAKILSANDLDQAQSDELAAEIRKLEVAGELTVDEGMLLRRELSTKMVTV